MSCPSAAEGKRKTRYANGPADAAYARNNEQLFERLLRLCDAQGWSRKRDRVGSDGDGSRKPGPSGLTVKIQQRIPRPADGQCGAAKRAGIDSNWSNKRLRVDEGVGMVSLPGQHPAATSSLGGGSNPNPTRGGGGGGGGGAGGESGSSTAVAAGSSSLANVAESKDTGMGYPATSSGLPPGYDTTAPQRYPKVGPPQGFSQRLSETPTEHQQPHTQLLQQQQLQRRQQQQEQQQQEQQQQELQQQRKQQQQQQQQQLQRQQQQQQQQQQQLQRQQQQHQQQQQLQQQRQQQSQQQQRQQQQKQKQRGAAGAGHLSPLPNGHQSSAPTYAEDPSMGLPYDAAQRVLQTQQAVADQLRNGPPHGVLQTGNRRRAVTPADGYLQQMGGVNTSVTANNSHGQGPGQYQEPNDPWTGTVHPGNNVFPQGGFHAHAPYYQPQQSPLPTAAAAAAALGGAVAVAHEASGTIVYKSRETSPLVQPALDMSAVGRAPSVAGGRGASLAAAQSQSVDKGLLEALGMGEGGHRPPAQAGGLMPPSSQFQQRDGLGARSTVEPPELAWVTDHRGPVDRDRLLNGTEGPAAGLGGLGQHYGDLRHASPPARFNDDSAYTENLEAAQMAARSLLPRDGRRAAARSAAEGMMHLGI